MAWGDDHRRGRFEPRLDLIRRLVDGHLAGEDRRVRPDAPCQRLVLERPARLNALTRSTRARPSDRGVVYRPAPRYRAVTSAGVGKSDRLDN